MSQTSSNTSYRCIVNANDINPGINPGFNLTPSATVGDAQVLALAAALKQAFVSNGFPDATVEVSKDVLTDVHSQADFTATPPVFD